MEIKIPGRCEAGQPKGFMEGLSVYHYGYGRGRALRVWLCVSTCGSR